jgi:hypothetical protein
MFDDDREERHEAQPPGGGGVTPPGANIPGWLLPLSIVGALLCLPTGIAAIIYSVQARTKSQAGDTAGASQAAKNAQIWVVVSVVAGVLAFFVLLAGG